MEQNKANQPQNDANGSNTGAKLRKMPEGKPFVKGDDPRRNLKGRPRSFDQCRELAQQIAHEELRTQGGDVLTVAEAVLRSWAKSKQPLLQKAFIEYAFGKVPDKINLGDNEGKSLKPMVIQVITQVPLPEHERVN